MKKTIIILSTLSLFSCRSVKKDIEKVEIEKETTEKVESKKEIEEVRNSITFKNSYEIRPLDIEKPMIIGGKTYYNTIFKTVYETDKQHVQTKQKEAVKSDKKIYDKENKITRKIDRTVTLGSVLIYGGVFFLLWLVLSWIFRKYINKKK